MISAILSQRAVDAGRYLAAVSTSVANAVTGMIKEWHYRGDIHKLHSMSDRQLSDIGLTRGRIEEAVRGGASHAVTRDTSLRSVFHP